MFDIKMEFIRGVFFVRLEGELTVNTTDIFEREVLSLLNKQGIYKVVLNLDKLYYLDERGANTLIKLSNIINNNNGRLSLCSLSSIQVKEELYKVMDYHVMEANTELGAMRMMNV